VTSNQTSASPGWRLATPFMKAFRPAMVLAGALLAGGICGCACKRDAAMKLATDSAYASAFLGVTDAFEPLRELRSGDTNEAIEVLENRLDRGIIELSAVLPEETDQEKRAAYIRVLNKVRDYRAQHPWKSTISPEVDKDVAKALANIPAEGP